MVQLREKNADGADFCREAQAVIHIARPHGVCLLSVSAHLLLVVSLKGLFVTLQSSVCLQSQLLSTRSYVGERNRMWQYCAGG